MGGGVGVRVWVGGQLGESGRTGLSASILFPSEKAEGKVKENGVTKGQDYSGPALL